MSDEDFESVINANLTGAFRVSKRATKGLLKLKRGRLIFIGSVVGGVGAAGQVNYSASKSGLVGMARSFARELGSRGIPQM
jgi:3-oxoacyl-[acyl-carrier protein] reductase